MPPSRWRSCSPRSASAAGSDQHDSILRDVELVCRGGRQGVRSGCAGVGLPGDCPIGRCGDRPSPGSACALLQRTPMKSVPAGRFCLPVVPGRRRCAGTGASDCHRRAGLVAVAGAGGFAQRPCGGGQGGGRRDRNTARRHGDRDRWCLIDPQPGPQIDRKFRPIRAGADGGYWNSQLADRLLSQDLGARRRRGASNRGSTIWHESGLDAGPAGYTRITPCTFIDLDMSGGWVISGPPGRSRTQVPYDHPWAWINFC